MGVVAAHLWGCPGVPGKPVKKDELVEAYPSCTGATFWHEDLIERFYFLILRSLVSFGFKFALF